MYRALLCFALLAFCSAAPYGDVSASRTLPIRQEQQFIQQQPQQLVTAPKFVQQDETELVDTLGGGYSFFKKQPIVSRPLIQQKLAISEQQVPIASLDDSSIQWSDYTKASAFKQLPVQTHVVSTSNDLLVGGGYGQQQSASRSIQTIPSQMQARASLAAGYGNQHHHQQQQQDLDLHIPLAPKTLASGSQGPYGSSLAQEQHVLHNFVQQQPIVRTLDSGYGQQNVQTIAQEQPLQVLQPLVRNLGNSYGQQTVQTVAQEQPFQTVQPLIRNLGNGYGQQETQTIVQQDQPIIRNLAGGYGQQNVQTFAQEQKPLQVLQPLVRNLGNSYGQQTVQTVAQEQPFQTVQPLIRNLGNGYGQQAVQTVAQEQPFQTVQPLIRNLGNGYGQQETQTIVQQDQPIIRNLAGGYGQQNVQTVAQEQKPLQVLQPLVRNFGGSYGQQQQQQQQDLHSIFTVKSNSGYGQSAEQQRFLAPSASSVFTQPQQQSLAAPVQFSQPTFSVQQADFTHHNSPIMSSRVISQSQVPVQSSDSGSFAGW